MGKRRNFIKYEEAVIFVKSLSLKSRKEWLDYSKTKRASNIPASPDKTYKNNGWISWGEFLGNGNTSDNLREYLTYEDAKKYTHLLNIKSNREWNKYCKKGLLPDNIPTCVDRTYKNKGWVSWGDFLGTNRIAEKNRIFVSYEDCKKYAYNLNITSQKMWNIHCSSKKNPSNIPSTPNLIYKNKGWVSWGDFFGTNRIADQYKIFISYDECKKIIKKLNLKSYSDWKKYCKSGKRPSNIPASPDKTYKNNGWVSWGEFLDTKTIAPFNMQYLPYDEAKEYVRKLNLISESDWKDYIKINKIPTNIPKTPNTVYKNNGWLNYADFLGYDFKPKSSGELRIERYLIENKIKYTEQKTFDTCKNLALLKYDFYLEEYNILIEYDGKQHFEPTTLYGGENGFKKRLYLDNLKNEWANNNNIKLLRIPYYNFSKIETILYDYLNMNIEK